MGEEWFAVLPDSDSALTAARALHPSASHVVEHVSGRPWLLGHWPQGAVTVAVAGSVRVAVAGQCPATARSLREALRGVRSVHDVDKVAEGLPGCFHLLASVDGRVRVQGSLASVRRVLRARAGDAVVASDSGHVLSRLTGAGWDPAWLALRLSSMTTPFPLHESSPWRGVHAVPADHWLSLEPDGSAVEHRRWSPPDPELPMAEGAKAVREALTAAVSTRTAQGGTVSTDMSGGMDSTSLTFLAADGPAQLVTYRWAEADPANDDVRYASLAADALPHATHLVDPHHTMTPSFAELTREGPPADPEEPFPWVRNKARIAHVAGMVAASGSRMHLGGHGGDELFRPGSTYLHDLLRRQPRTALRQLRAARTLGRWPLPALLRALAEHHTPAEELARYSRRLRDPVPGGKPADVGFPWSPPPRMPSWATDDGTDIVREVLRDAAAAQPSISPLAPQRAQHSVLLTVRSTGLAVRQADRISAAVGPRLAAPYLDDQVLTAALSVRLSDRYSPWSFKPLLTTAMRGTVPHELLSRTTKGEFSADFFEGLRRHRADLLQLFDESELARHGLIDPSAVHKALLRPHTEAFGLAQLDATLACEMWLRSLHHPTNGRAAPGPHSGGGTVSAPRRPTSQPPEEPRAWQHPASQPNGEGPHTP